MHFDARWLPPIQTELKLADYFYSFLQETHDAATVVMLRNVLATSSTATENMHLRR